MIGSSTLTSAIECGEKWIIYQRKEKKSVLGIKQKVDADSVFCELMKREENNKSLAFQLRVGINDYFPPTASLDGSHFMLTLASFI